MTVVIKDPASHDLSVSFCVCVFVRDLCVWDLSSSSDQLNDRSGRRRENNLCMKGESVEQAMTWYHVNITPDLVSNVIPVALVIFVTTVCVFIF